MPAAPLPAVDPRRCPLCGQPNGCAMERERLTGVPQPPCWCASAAFGGELLERLPDNGRGQACICAACAVAAAR